MMKAIFLTLFIMHSGINLAATDVDTFVETLDKFEMYCVDQSDELREDVYVSDEFFSCRESLEYLKAEFKNREELMTSNPDVYKQFQDCVEHRDSPKVVPFVAEVQKVADGLTCNESEKKDFEKDCGKAWECNKLRAIKDGASLLPRVVRNPIQKYVRNTVKAKSYDSECIADGKSNCVKDFVYAFAANLWSSASSVWSLVSSGAKSLFSVSSWFDSEADKLHAKAIQSKKDVEDFWDNPGKWFSNLIDNIKKGVDDWVRTSVFCAKWEGKPQFSKCLQPLENYDCIDCDDKINATCVAIGAISSEVGVAFLTAGVGTAASLTARAGAKTLAVVAGKVSSKVKAVAPSFSKSTKASKVSSVSKVAAAVGAGVSKSTAVAAKIYSVTSEKALRVKEKIEKISKAVGESKVVMVTKAIVEKGNIPGRLSEKIAEKGVLAGAKVVSTVGKGAVKADAEKIVKIAQRAKNSDRAQKLLSSRTHEKSRLSGHNAKATTLVRRGERVPDSSNIVGGGHSGHGSSSSHSDTGNHYNSNNDHPSQRDRSVANYEDSHSREDRTNRGERVDQKNTNSQKSPNQNAKSESQRRADQKRKDEQRKVAEQKKRDKEKKARDAREEHEEKSKKDLHVSKKAVAATLATHLAAKGVVISNEQSEKEAERIQNMANGDVDDFNNSLVSAKKVLGVDSTSAFSERAFDQASAVKDIYSESNRDNVVSAIQKSNSDLNKNDAEELFSKRKKEVDSAYNYMDRLKKNSSTTTAAKKVISAKEELKNIGRRSEINELGNELSKLSKQREAFENETIGAESSEDSRSEVISTEASNNISSSVSGEKRLARSPSSSVSTDSQASSGGSSSTVSSARSNERSDEGSQYAEIQDIEAPLESVAVGPGIVDNDLIEEAISKSKEDSKDDDSEKNKNKSSELKGLLKRIVNTPAKVENNILFSRDLSAIKTTTEGSKERYKSLVSKVEKSELVQKKTTYTIGKEKLELYQFKSETFHLKINERGTVELLDNKSGLNLLNRAALNL